MKRGLMNKLWRFMEVYTIYKVENDKLIPTSYSSNSKRTVSKITSILNKRHKNAYEYYDENGLVRRESKKAK